MIAVMAECDQEGMSKFVKYRGDTFRPVWVDGVQSLD